MHMSDVTHNSAVEAGALLEAGIVTEGAKWCSDVNPSYALHYDGAYPCPFKPCMYINSENSSFHFPKHHDIFPMYALQCIITWDLCMSSHDYISVLQTQISVVDHQDNFSLGI